MGWIALVLAILGGAAIALPGPGLYICLGLGILSVGVGIAGYRRRQDPGWARLAGAAAITVGSLAIVLGATKYGLTLAALRKLEGLFG